MDKKYYSPKHKRYSKKNKKDRSAFLMRLNISLGISIVVLGLYNINSEKIANIYRDLVNYNISFSQVKSVFNEVVNRGGGIKGFAQGGDGSVILDDGIVEYIESYEDSYALNNNTAISP